MLALPLALALAFCLYLPLPRAADLITEGIYRLYAAFLRLFRRKSGKIDEPVGFALFLLLWGGIFQLAGSLHMLVAAVITAPLFRAIALLTPAARAKEELDSGTLARDREGYEARVREVCSGLGPAFISDACLPLLLLALSTPLHLNSAAGGLLLCLRALDGRQTYATRAFAQLRRPARAVMRGLWLLCSCVVGRNPLHVRGEDSRTFLLSLLGIAQDQTDTHAPVSGDIAQAVFLCCFTTVMLALVLTLLLIPFR